MKVNIELALRTQEVFKLFERKIDNDRLLIHAILHKFNIVMGHSKQRGLQTSSSFHQIEQAMVTLTQQFSDEMGRFNEVLNQRKDFNNIKINFIAKFHPMITVSNPLGMRLVEFIEIYDQLVATIKLLNLAGCFMSDNDYYTNIKRIQKLANQMLSNVIPLSVINRRSIKDLSLNTFAIA